MNHYDIFYPLIGIISGLAAGIFGIGGGTIVVPALAFLLPYVGLPTPAIMHMAVGTSFAVMLITSTVSSYAHHKHQHVVWPIIQQLLPSIFVGVISGAILTYFLSTKILEILFSLFLFYIAYRMFFVRKTKPERHLPHWSILSIFGFLIGTKSGLLGIGGGSIIIPLLTYFNIPMRNAAGTSAVCTLVVAMIGSVCFLTTGWNAHVVPYSLGYIYWPAFLGIVITSLICAPIGATLSHHLRSNISKKLFALLLLFGAIKMMI